MLLRQVKLLMIAAFSLCAILFSNASNAQDTAKHQSSETVTVDTETKEAEEFNVTETILEHIKDDHSWHLWGHTSIALPVILYSDKGLEIFFF
jgi:F-type H+-transporting ATPase subunit a